MLRLRYAVLHQILLPCKRRLNQCLLRIGSLLSVRHFLQPIAADFYYLGVLDSLPCIMSIRRGMVLERNRACVELLNLLLDLDLNFLLRQCLASSKSKPQDDV